MSRSAMLTRVCPLAALGAFVPSRLPVTLSAAWTQWVNSKKSVCSFFSNSYWSFRNCQPQISIQKVWFCLHQHPPSYWKTLFWMKDSKLLSEANSLYVIPGRAQGLIYLINCLQIKTFFNFHCTHRCCIFSAPGGYFNLSNVTVSEH